MVEVRVLLICQSEGLRNRYAHLAGYEESDDNSGLTALGWEQTNALANWLKLHEKIDVLISAPQLRSRLTAQRIAQVLGMAVKVRMDLPRHAADRMRTPGSNGEMPRSLQALASRVPPPEDPEYHSFCMAVVKVIDDLLAEHWGKTIAIVLGGVAVAAITREFFGAQTLPIAVNHSGITEFNRRNGQWRLAYANRREHLPMPTLASAPQVTGSGGAGNLDPGELDHIIAVYNRVGMRPRDEQVEVDRRQRMRDLLRFAHLPPELRVLDLGTGAGLLALMLAEDGAREVIGVDISPVMLENAEYQRLSLATPAAGRVSFRLAPAQMLPFGDESFDAVVCRLMLQHAQKPERILQEAARVLKINGVLIFAGALGADDPVKRATQNAIEERRNPAHVAARTADQYRKLIIGAGLVIESEKVTIFDRELEEWLNDMLAEAANRAVVRDMMEAGMETDASGLHVRKQGGKIVFDQRLFYVRAIKRP